MTATVVSAPLSATVHDAMRIMTEKRIRHLPVMTGDRLEGVVSIGDLVRKVVTTQGEIIQQLQQYISGQSLA